MVLVHKPRSKLELGFAEGLVGNCSVRSGNHVMLPFNETTVKGCFAVGDVGTPAKVAVAGVAFGTLAAAGLVMQLQAD
jgi:thioredoxin reductase